MEKIKFLILLVLLSSCASKKIPEKKTITLLNYNIRYAQEDVGDISWSNRNVNFLQLIKDNPAEIYLFQEPTKDQVFFLENQFPAFHLIENGLRPFDSLSTHNVMLIHESLKIIKHDAFWLSETPDKISRGWDASTERICQYVLVKDKISKKEFYVFNVHLDRKGEESKRKSLELIKQKAKEINTKNLPIFIGGDFNSMEHTSQIQDFKDFLRDSKEVSLTPPKGPSGTFNFFDVNRENFPYRIDYIFVSDSIKVKKYEVIDTKYNNQFPSDHFPVKIEVEF
ncbi:endonuclease/exonuclease/phosphatase family protein [Mesonia sp. K7]|uniref:endonuclease/exonuclease/phosphatase family protein n=1 Tax=Mesonia sp. K7 TaxID=2218606 RepID=UPI0013146958|nr:endonuclease/exonuclease/phosphatase family protein [Mesonia sp. K7]